MTACPLQAVKQTILYSVCCMLHWVPLLKGTNKGGQWPAFVLRENRSPQLIFFVCSAFKIFNSTSLLTPDSREESQKYPLSRKL